MNMTQSPVESVLDALTEEQRQLLAAALEEYMNALEAGAPPDLTALQEKYSSIAAPLMVYIDSLDYLHDVAAEAKQDKSSESLVDAAPVSAHGILGDFELHRELGRGGMGIVYEATQKSLGRKVALKVLPFAAVLDRRQITRFQNEAQAAAQLHHTNIVPVYSVGCDRGVHYYAMQFIDGQPMDRAIRDLRGIEQGQHDSSVGVDDPDATQDLPPATPQLLTGSSPTVQALTTAASVKNRDFVRLAVEKGIQVASGLDHAHSYGILHRDIKPSNLLIDNLGDVWITDFGLARIQSDANITCTGDVLGTARYMSPEQAAGKTNLLDQRTDIYSLGATLYELLTLRPAFDGDNRAEIVLKITTSEPVSPRQHNPSIPVDLETILMKAMAKESAGRYASAREFAEDLQRFLDGKPTLAKRPTVVDRALKWASRHRGYVMTAIVLLAFALIGLSASTLLISAARDKAESNFQLSEGNRVKAEHNFHQARRIVDGLAERAAQLEGIPEAVDVRKALLTDALRYYHEFIRDEQHSSSLSHDLAEAHIRHGDVQLSLDMEDEALESYQEALTIFRQLETEQPRPALSGQAISLTRIAELDSREGNWDKALLNYAAALKIQRGLLTQRPSDLDLTLEFVLTLNNLSQNLRQSGRFDEAEAYLREAVQLLGTHQANPEHRENQFLLNSLAVTKRNLGFLLGRENPADGIDYVQQVVETQKQLVKLHPKTLNYAHDLATSYNNLGALHSRTEAYSAAQRAYAKQTAILTQLIPQAPLRIAYKLELAIAYNNLGQMARQQFLSGEIDDSSPATEHFRNARQRLQRLIDFAPHELNYYSALGVVLNNLGMVFEDEGNLAEAIKHYVSAIEFQRVAFAAQTQAHEYAGRLDEHYRNLARAQFSAGQHAESLKTMRGRVELFPHDRQHKIRVSRSLLTRLSEDGDLSESVQARWQEEALDLVVSAMADAETLEKLVAEEPFGVLRGHPDYEKNLESLKEK